MSLTIPNQIRSIDPWSENRFSDNYNLRSRMLTGGKDVILFFESFKMKKTGDHTFQVDAGLFIKDDVMIHVLEDTEIDISKNQGLMVSGLSEPPLVTDSVSDYYIHLFINYKYVRSQPPPQARFELIRSGVPTESINQHYSDIRHMWLGRVRVEDGIITNVSEAPIVVGDPDITLRRRYLVSPLSGYMVINCGVIRDDQNWYADWED